MNMGNAKIFSLAKTYGGKAIKTFSKNSPTILTGCALTGLVITVVLAVKATPNAARCIKEEKRKHLDRLVITNGDEGISGEEKEEMLEEVPLTKIEIVKATWKEYIPTGLAIFGTGACIIGSHSISAKRTAAMAALYSMSETALQEYKDKAVEVVGKGKAEKIRDEILSDKVRNGPSPGVPIPHTGHGETLCYEPITGRYFYSSIDHIKNTIADLNIRMATGDDRISLNEYFYALGLDGVKYGEDQGWNVESRIDPRFNSSLTSNGTPCLVIDHNNSPFAWYVDC